MGIKNYTVSGDTRFDRVVKVAKESRTYPAVENFVKGYRVVLAGSTWPEDEELIRQYIANAAGDARFIIAPHEVHAARIRNLAEMMGKEKVLLYSELESNTADAAKKILIIDGIGFLSGLYRYATVAYIGGGFGAGIHNILEAATFGKPVIFGPKYGKFREAVDLVKAGGAFPINDAGELSSRLSALLESDKDYRKSAETCSGYVRSHCGATDEIIKRVSGFLAED